MPLRTLSGKHGDARKGRGAGVNPEGRFEQVEREAFDDGWDSAAREEERVLKTVVTDEHAKSILSRNDSPDIPFTQSINPYQGCEHGCIYCYARPSHAYRNLSPGVDFETRIFAKVNAAELLRKELSKPGYRCELIALGANTDPYQPAERERRITRGILEVCAEFNQPVGIVTKNALVERDIDLLAPMAAKGLAEVFVSVTTLDHELARRMEPRCSAPARRLQAVRALAQAGIPTGVMVAPVVPFLNDHEIEALVAAAAEHGARRAAWILMRLPYEVKTLFRDWLRRHYPLKAEHVMSRVQQLRGGRDNDPNFGSRMRGGGELAQLIGRRFDIACKKAGLNQARRGEGMHRNTALFRVPGAAVQGRLF
jgi:DNA repair photolyase